MTEANGLGEAVAAVTDRVKDCTKIPATSSDSLIKIRQRMAEARTAMGRMLGQRYEDCSISTFECHGDTNHVLAQEAVKTSLRCFLDGDMKRNLVLYGPPGTGKDHFLAACIGAALYRGLTVQHYTGADLFADKEDLRRGDVPEKEIVTDLLKHQILAISDPVPWGKEALTESQAAFLGRVVDARYRRLLPVWVTINVTGFKAMSNRLGSPIADRLRDDALVLKCDWPTYRESVKGESK